MLKSYFKKIKKEYRRFKSWFEFRNLFFVTTRSTLLPWSKGKELQYFALRYLKDCSRVRYDECKKSGNMYVRTLYKNVPVNNIRPSMIQKFWCYFHLWLPLRHAHVVKVVHTKGHLSELIPFTIWLQGRKYFPV